MNFKNPRKTHWTVPLAWVAGLLFYWAPVQAQTSGSAPMRSEVLKPLAAAQEALKNNQRLWRMYDGWRRFSAEEQVRIREQAARFLATLA